MIKQWQGKIYRLPINAYGIQNAMAFQGECFEMAPNGVKGAVPGRQFHWQTIKYYINLITSFLAIE
ncbi:MAG: hypothetical protein ABSF60_03475 [Verrucomicrobiota bacterium]